MDSIVSGSAINGLLNGLNSAEANSRMNSQNLFDSYQDSSSFNAAYNEAMSYGKTYGSEATLANAIMAEQANAQAQNFWNQQSAYNALEASKNRAFQEYMSNTSYQRAVKDMIAAGINPILAATQGGAAVTQGATAQSGLAASHQASAIADSENYSNSYGYSSGGSSSHGESHDRGYSQSTSASEKGLLNGLGKIFNNLSDLIGKKNATGTVFK